MDNLSGNPNYFKSTDKKSKKTTEPDVAVVVVDYADLKKRGTEIQQSLQELRLTTGDLYIKFSKKELGDLITSFEMANRDILKLLNSIENKQ
jgi:hypothetical protein